MAKKSSLLKLFAASAFFLSIIAILSLSFFSSMTHASTIGWSVVSSPNASPNENSLQAVAALPTHKAWAVGYSVQGTTKSNVVQQTLIEYYNGTAWHIVTSPNVGTGNNALTGVAAISEKNVWAVGSSSIGALVLHFNGNQWNVVSAPITCQLKAITAISANDVWAVGVTGLQSCTEHFDGHNWNLISTPKVGTSDNTLLGVSAVSEKNVWAVGNYCTGNGCDRGGGTISELILHFDGSHWNAVSGPATSAHNNQLNAITAISAKNIWAVGAVWTTALSSSTLIIHFDGVRWTQVANPSANTSMSSLNAIAFASKNNLFAVGMSRSASGSTTLIEHFNGTTWSMVTSPTSGKNGVLNGLVHVPDAMQGTAQFWAVGSNNTVPGSTLIERNS